MSPGEPLVVADGLTRRFTRAGVTRVALDDVSFTLAAGETLSIIGESGSGKTTLTRLVAGLDTPSSGSIEVAGTPPKVRPGRLSPVQMVFQHPTDALNPFMSIGRSVAEPLRALPRARRDVRVAELLRGVGLDPGRARQRPSAFSGGQLQRVVIARAMAPDPTLLLCDEPTSALDVSVQAQIINLLLAAQASRGFACVFVTHDLTVARVVADHVLVLKDGRAVEYTDADSFFAHPRHEYSQRLIKATSQQALGEGSLATGPHTAAGRQ